MNSGYVHGYDAGESARLADQASALADLLHADTSFPEGALVLEAGCGTGAQTMRLAAHSPRAQFVSVDVSAASLAEAEAKAGAAGFTHVRFARADILALPFALETFDHVFVCFVLEHLPEPVGALRALRGLLKPGGAITAIEGDHGSACFHPDDVDARAAIAAQVALQARAGGDALIGRRLHPLLREAGFAGIHVAPRMVYVDGGRPDLAQACIRDTFAAMIAGVRDGAIGAGLIASDRFDRGVEALHRAAEPDGVFCYTFFKAVAARTA